MLQIPTIQVPAVVVPPQFNTGVKPNLLAQTKIPPVVIRPTVSVPKVVVPAVTVPTPVIKPQITPQLPTQSPVVPVPKVVVPRVNTTTQPTQGGILKQFGGGTGVITVGTVPEAMATPTINIVEETGYTMLIKLLDTWKGTEQQARQLADLTYEDGGPIIDIKRRDVLNEIIGMLYDQPFDDVVDFLTDARDPGYIVWDQKSMDEGRVKVAREIVIQQAEEVGIKGVGKCRYCNSTELVFSQRQLRSGDEPASVFVRCVLCTKQWRQQ